MQNKRLTWQQEKHTHSETFSEETQADKLAGLGRTMDQQGSEEKIKITV